MCLTLGWNVENSEVKPVAWTDRRITHLRTQTNTRARTHARRNTLTNVDTVCGYKDFHKSQRISKTFLGNLDNPSD